MTDEEYVAQLREARSASDEEYVDGLRKPKSDESYVAELRKRKEKAAERLIKLFGSTPGYEKLSPFEALTKFKNESGPAKPGVAESIQAGALGVAKTAAPAVLAVGSGALIGTALAPGLGTIGGAIAGGLSSLPIGALAAKAQSAIGEAIRPGATKELEQVAEEHPVADFAGEMIPGFAMAKLTIPGRTAYKAAYAAATKAGATKAVAVQAARSAALVQMGTGAGLGAGLNAVGAVMEGHMPTAEGLATGAATGTLLGDARFHPKSPKAPPGGRAAKESDAAARMDDVRADYLFNLAKSQADAYVYVTTPGEPMPGTPRFKKAQALARATAAMEKEFGRKPTGSITDEMAKESATKKSKPLPGSPDFVPEAPATETQQAMLARANSAFRELVALSGTKGIRATNRTADLLAQLDELAARGVVPNASTGEMPGNVRVEPRATGPADPEQAAWLKRTTERNQAYAAMEDEFGRPLSTPEARAIEDHIDEAGMQGDPDPVASAVAALKVLPPPPGPETMAPHEAQSIGVSPDEYAGSIKTAYAEGRPVHPEAAASVPAVQNAMELEAALPDLSPQTAAEKGAPLAPEAPEAPEGTPGYRSARSGYEPKRQTWEQAKDFVRAVGGDPSALPEGSAPQVIAQGYKATQAQTAVVKAALKFSAEGTPANADALEVALKELGVALEPLRGKVTERAQALAASKAMKGTVAHGETMLDIADVSRRLGRRSPARGAGPRGRRGGGGHGARATPGSAPAPRRYTAGSQPTPDDRLAFLAQVAEQIGKMKNPEEVANLANAKMPSRAIRWEDRTLGSKIGAGSWEVLQSQLFTPLSIARELVSDVAMAFISPVERTATAALGAGRAAVGLPGADRAYFREVPAAMSAFISEGPNALRRAVARARAGVSANVYAEEAQGYNVIPGKIGHLARGFRPGLSIGTETFEGMHLKGETAALATRQAIVEGKTGQAFKDRVNFLIANPGEVSTGRIREKRAAWLESKSILDPATGKVTEHLREKARVERFKYLLDHPEEIRDQTRSRGLISGQAKEYAQEHAFTNDNIIGTKISQFKAWASVKNFPVFGPVLPFHTVRLNIMAGALKRLPGTNLMLPTVVKDIQAGGVSADRAAARMVLGSGLMAFIGYHASKGNIVGSRPARNSGAQHEQPSKETQGSRENSIRVGDEWVSLDSIPVVGEFTRLAADMFALKDQMGDDSVTGFALASAHSLGKWMENTSFAEDFVSVADILDGDTHAYERLRNSIATMPIPRTLGWMAATADPGIRRAKTILEAAKKQIPGLRNELPAVMTLFGDEQKASGSMVERALSPLPRTSISTDKSAAALKDLRMRIDRPRRDVIGHLMDNEEYTAYQKTLGKAVQAAVDGHVKEDWSWSSYDENEKRAKLTKAIADAKEIVRDDWIANHPDIEEAWKAKQKRKKEGYRD